MTDASCCDSAESTSSDSAESTSSDSAESTSSDSAESTSSLGICPSSGTQGQKVPWTTVAALVRGVLPARQNFWLCRDPACAVVYFGLNGATIGVPDLHVEPGFKNPVDGLLCYCFGQKRSDLEREILESGKTTIPDKIRAETRAGNCACEVRNPSGRCCLGAISRFVRTVLAPSVVGE